jgi:hypothetical protein
MFSYIGRQTAAGQRFLLPKLAGAALRLNDGEAYVLLELLANSGLLDRVFNIYCRKTGTLLTTVENEEDLYKVPYCHDCDYQHDSHDLRLEIAFRPAEDAEFQEAA